MSQPAGASSAPRNNYNNRYNSNNNNATTIDLVEVFRVLWHWAWLLLLIALICGTAGYCFSRFVLPEEFTSTTKIYILNKTDATSGALSNSDLQASSQLTQDYAELITSHDVLDKVITDLQLPYDYNTLLGKISITTPTDTRIVSIAVTDTDPKMAQTLAVEIREDASAHIKSVMDLDAVNVAEQATLPTEKSAPSNSRWAIVAALIGFLVTAAVLIIQYLMDDTVRTPDDVSKFLEMSTLSQIPSDEAVVESSIDSRTKGQRRGHKYKTLINQKTQPQSEEYPRGTSHKAPAVKSSESPANARQARYDSAAGNSRQAGDDRTSADTSQTRRAGSARQGREYRNTASNARGHREEQPAQEERTMLHPEYTTVDSHSSRTTRGSSQGQRNAAQADKTQIRNDHEEKDFTEIDVDRLMEEDMEEDFDEEIDENPEEDLDVEGDQN